jgi:hypothetical protein
MSDGRDTASPVQEGTRVRGSSLSGGRRTSGTTPPLAGGPRSKNRQRTPFANSDYSIPYGDSVARLKTRPRSRANSSPYHVGLKALEMPRSNRANSADSKVLKNPKVTISTLMDEDGTVSTSNSTSRVDSPWEESEPVNDEGGIEKAPQTISSRADSLDSNISDADRKKEEKRRKEAEKKQKALAKQQEKQRAKALRAAKAQLAKEVAKKLEAESKGEYDIRPKTPEPSQEAFLSFLETQKQHAQAAVEHPETLWATSPNKSPSRHHHRPSTSLSPAEKKAQAAARRRLERKMAAFERKQLSSPLAAKLPRPARPPPPLHMSPKKTRKRKLLVTSPATENGVKGGRNQASPGGEETDPANALQEQEAPDRPNEQEQAQEQTGDTPIASNSADAISEQRGGGKGKSSRSASKASASGKQSGHPRSEPSKKEVAASRRQEYEASKEKGPHETNDSTTVTIELPEVKNEPSSPPRESAEDAGQVTLDEQGQSEGTSAGGEAIGDTEEQANEEQGNEELANGELANEELADEDQDSSATSPKNTTAHEASEEGDFTANNSEKQDKSFAQDVEPITHQDSHRSDVSQEELLEMMTRELELQETSPKALAPDDEVEGFEGHSRLRSSSTESGNDDDEPENDSSEHFEPPAAILPDADDDVIPGVDVSYRTNGIETGEMMVESNHYVETPEESPISEGHQQEEVYDDDYDDEYSDSTEEEEEGEEERASRSEYHDEGTTDSLGEQHDAIFRQPDMDRYDSTLSVGYADAKNGDGPSDQETSAFVISDTGNSSYGDDAEDVFKEDFPE